MYVFKPDGSQFWHCEFEYAGERIRRTTRCKNERDAKRVASDIKRAMKQAAAIKLIVERPDVSLRLEDAALRYWEEKGQHLAGPKNVNRDLVRITEFFGVGKLITDITDADVARLVEARRKDRVIPTGGDKMVKDCRFVSAGTVNHTVLRLQTLIRHAKEEWKVKFPDEPVWRKHKLSTTKTPARVFEANEKERFDKATRDDYVPILAFADESGKRLAYCYGLKWRHVHWARSVIEKPGKRKPSGEEKIEVVAITPEIRAILEPLRNHHAEFVFTYVAQRSFGGRKRGERYPITQNNLITRFRRICAKAGIEDFGFHSMRRSAATEFYHANDKDLLLTQRFLGHGDPKTTERYIRVDDQNVRQGMEARAKQRAGVRKVSSAKR